MREIFNECDDKPSEQFSVYFFSRDSSEPQVHQEGAQPSAGDLALDVVSHERQDDGAGQEQSKNLPVRKIEQVKMIFGDVSNIRKFYFEELELVFIFFKLFLSSFSSQIWKHSLIASYKLTWWEAAMSFDLMMMTDKGLNKFVEEEKRWQKAAQLVINPEW